MLIKRFLCRPERRNVFPFALLKNKEFSHRPALVKEGRCSSRSSVDFLKWCASTLPRCLVAGYWNILQTPGPQTSQSRYLQRPRLKKCAKRKSDKLPAAMQLALQPSELPTCQPRIVDQLIQRMQSRVEQNLQQDRKQCLKTWKDIHFSAQMIAINTGWYARSRNRRIVTSPNR